MTLSMVEPVLEEVTLERISEADQYLTGRYEQVLQTNTELDRTLVSFQANKGTVESRWFKYKEGFSLALMHYIFNKVGITQGRIMDPFAGAGTALFAASDRGMDATGIELLPSSTEIIEVRKLLRQGDRQRMASAIQDFIRSRVWESEGEGTPFPHIAITRGAFPPNTEELLGRYLYEVQRIDNPSLARVLRFAALCTLESVSFTRKDGQFLRWDYRSGRCWGKKRFDKGPIPGFTEAIVAKTAEIVCDLCSPDGATLTLFDEFPSPSEFGQIELLQGSCLDILPTLGEASFDGIITSPPYCNRYDYTRTYALELAMMGVGEEGIRHLRQSLLSCTVENKEKEILANVYPYTRFRGAMDAFASQDMLQRVLSYLKARRADSSINNSGIPRMVENYFREMALVIFECARVLKPGSPMVMVNDNVRYHGAHVPVDLILSDFAEQAGFKVETIWVLPRGKGNSSQQMGAHGREELRKCVYVWRRIET